MEDSGKYLSGNLGKHLLSTLTSREGEFLEALCAYIVDTGISEQKKITIFFRNSKLFILSSNSNKTFYQAGGNPVYAALVLAYQKYSCVVYVGILTQADQNKISSIRNFFKDHQFECNLEVKSSCECIVGSVYAITDASVLSAPLEYYVNNSEVYLKRSLAKKFTKISKNMFISFDKRLYLVTNLQLSSIPYFVFFQELSAKVNICDIYDEMNESLCEKEVDPYEKSRIINRIHLAYCSMDLMCIIECFCSLLYQIALELNDSTENNFELFQDLSFLILDEFFLWNVYFIIFRTDLTL